MSSETLTTVESYPKWSCDMVTALITEVRSLWPKLQEGIYTKEMLYEDASLRLCQKGYDVTPYRVKKKWHNLTTSYKRSLIRIKKREDKAIKFDYFEELHDLLGDMPFKETVSSPSVMCSSSPGTSHMQVPTSESQTVFTLSSSPEHPRKRLKPAQPENPILFWMNTSNDQRRMHNLQQLKQAVKLQQPKSPPCIDDQTHRVDASEGREARREWREWKRQQEMMNMQKEGNKILESINENLSAIRTSLEIIVHKLNK